MRRLRSRRLHPESGQGDVDDCFAGDCSSPPRPPVAPVPAPAPPPSVRSSPSPCPSEFARSPAPVPTASSGRRDQGRSRYGSPPGGGGGNHHSRLVTYALISVAAIAFVSLILLAVSVVVRRRQARRRRQALLAAPAAAAPADADDPEGGGGGGGVVHHVWYIRTVGLDEAAIGSIAATRYRAGAGLLGAADCTVCLGEFRDGELVRLLPKCGHAFHVPCIDTWLRAHVNCPLCRSDVLGPVVVTAGGTADGESSATSAAEPADDNNAAAEQADATSDAVAEHGQEDGDHRGASPEEEDNHHSQSSLPEPLPPLPCPLPHYVRRAASMDAAMMSAAAALERLPEAEAPEEEEQSSRRKRGTGPSGANKASGSCLRRNLSTDRPASVGIPRSFFSRHCRARSSVLPL